MALDTSTLSWNINASASKTVAGSTLKGSTVTSALTALTDGAGADQADDIVDHLLNSNNVAVALSSMKTTLDEAVSAQTKIKAVILVDQGNATATVSSNITGFPSGQLVVGGSLFYLAPTSGGLTCTSANTITSNGTTGQNVRVIMFMS